MPKKNQVDFMGMKKSPKFFSGSHSSFGKRPNKSKGKPMVNFLNSKQKPIKQRISNKRRVNNKPIPMGFLNKGKVMPKQKYINWDYKQIKKKFPGINPYGDADMDGSMNYKDCKPFDASKDGKLFDKIKSIFSPSDEKRARITKKAERVEKVRGVVQRATKGIVKRKRSLGKKLDTGTGVDRFERVISRQFPSKKQFAKTRKGIQRAAVLAGIPVKQS